MAFYHEGPASEVLCETSDVVQGEDGLKENMGEDDVGEGAFVRDDGTH